MSSRITALYAGRPQLKTRLLDSDDILVAYRPGRKHSDSDALRRSPIMSDTRYLFPTYCDRASLDIPNTASEQRKDPWIGAILQYLSGLSTVPKLRETRRQDSHCAISDDCSTAGTTHLKSGSCYYSFLAICVLTFAPTTTLRHSRHNHAEALPS